jgi:hypothetical protein
MGPPSYLRSFIERHVVMRHMTVSVSSDGILKWQSCNVCSKYACDVGAMHLVVASSNILVQAT